MVSITWGPDLAEVYDDTYAAGFAPSVLDPVVGLLGELAGSGPALEFAVGTGRVALALSARGIPCMAWSCRGPWPTGCSPSLAEARFR